MKQSDTDWKRLESMTDEEIDFSDTAELDEQFFLNAEVRLPQRKQQVSVRLDAEVLDWFKKQGNVKTDRQGLVVLLWKPFTDKANVPRWFKNKRKPEPVSGKVTITALVNGWCTGQNLAYERAKHAAAEFGDKVLFQEIDALDRQTMTEWGHADVLFIDDKQVRTGPPPSFEKIVRLIARIVRKL